MYTHVLGFRIYINFNAGLPQKDIFFCKYACFLTKHIIACIIGYYLIHFLDSQLIVSVLEDNVTTK